MFICLIKILNFNWNSLCFIVFKLNKLMLLKFVSLYFIYSQLVQITKQIKYIINIGRFYV